MDPNVTLRLIRELYSRPILTNDQVDGFVSLVEDLDDWLSRGGFLPDAWKRVEHRG